MKNILTYSNGWGHLVMSMFMTIVGIVLILYPGDPPSAQGVGIGLILAVQAAWFVPGAAKQVATEVVKALPTGPLPTVQMGSTPIDMQSTLQLPAQPKGVKK